MPEGTLDRREQGVEQHLAAAAEYIAIAESGDAEQSAYEHAADEIIAAQADDPALSFVEIDRRLGRSEKGGGQYSGRLVRWRTSTTARTSPFGGDTSSNRARDNSAAKRTASERPDQFAAAFDAAPPEARRQIAERISRAPEVRSEARKRDVEAEQRTRPNPVPPRADHMLHQAEGKLDLAERAMREFIAIINELDQPGDDEDIIEHLDRIEQLAQAGREGYTTGKSIDTWALELWEQRGADR